MRRIVFGCGYLGHRVAKLWRERGDLVHVTTRSADRGHELSAEGFHPIQLDVTVPDTLSGLPEVDTALIAIGFDRSAGLSIHETYVTGLTNLLAAIQPRPSRIIYISSTGVYGQSDDGWVDEQSACRPEREGGRACLAAEQLLRNHEFGPRAIILRLAGIYGPGRIPHFDRIVGGQPIPVQPSGYLNLIHVDDAARTVIAAGERAMPPKIYVVADGTPVRRGEFYAEVARRTGSPAPVFLEPRVGSSATFRSAGSKRVSNHKLLQEMEIAFSFPDYRTGLEAIFRSKPA